MKDEGTCGCRDLVGMCHSPSEVGELGTGGALTSNLVPAHYRPLGAGPSRAGEPLTLTQRIHTVLGVRELLSPPCAASARGTRAGNLPGWTQGSKMGARKGLFGIFQSSLLSVVLSLQCAHDKPCVPVVCSPTASQHMESFPAPFGCLIPASHSCLWLCPIPQRAGGL